MARREGGAQRDWQADGWRAAVCGEQGCSNENKKGKTQKQDDCSWELSWGLPTRGNPLMLTSATATPRGNTLAAKTGPGVRGVCGERMEGVCMQNVGGPARVRARRVVLQESCPKQMEMRVPGPPRPLASLRPTQAWGPSLWSGAGGAGAGTVWEPAPECTAGHRGQPWG